MKKISQVILVCRTFKHSWKIIILLAAQTREQCQASSLDIVSAPLTNITKETVLLTLHNSVLFLWRGASSSNTFFLHFKLKLALFFQISSIFVLKNKSTPTVATCLLIIKVTQRIYVKKTSVNMER